ncbi:MAG TPA: 30S ribosome-binding factor RbfA [Actinomycetales bacterium]|nr:30S ribosome-binding factor RbfA [Actinomycetales bacterium]
MTPSPRAARLADRIKVLVAEQLDRKVKDPRLGYVTVTDVRVTNDLQHATIFWTVLGDEEERDATAAALESAKGMLRSEVGRHLNVRLIPTLDFVMDAIPETTANLAKALSEAAARDAQLAALRENSRYAGDTDPYKAARDAEVNESASSDEEA